VTEKKHKKGNPPTGSGIPELIPVKIPIWGSPNWFGVHSKLGTNIYTPFSKACVYQTQGQYERSNVLLTEMLQSEFARNILSVEFISAVEKFQVVMKESNILLIM